MAHTGHPNSPCSTCEYILDIYFADGLTHIWTKRSDGTTTHYPLFYHPRIYVAADKDASQYAGQGRRSLEAIHRQVQTHQLVLGTDLVPARLSSSHDQTTTVIRVLVHSPQKLDDLVRDFKAKNFNLYNIDLNARQQFFVDLEVSPMMACHIKLRQPHLLYKVPRGGVEIEQITVHDDPTSVYYPLPPVSMMDIRLEVDSDGTFPTYADTLLRIHVTKREFDGDDGHSYPIEGTETHILRQLVRHIREFDPDFLNIINGDKFVVNYLAHRAAHHGLTSEFILGRLPRPVYPRRERQGQTYMSYGQIMRREQVWYLPGRVHIDAENSFFMYEAGLAGLIDLARLSGVPPERTSRSSIGTALTGIEFRVNAATTPITLVPPNKASGEQFKPAEHLLISDNGGLIYPAHPGLYMGVWAIDFTSLYPMIMAIHNIGNETVLCPHEECQGELARRVPEVEYHICQKKVGVVPRTMFMVLQKRLQLKMLKSRPIPQSQREKFRGIDSAMKWILVSCLDGGTRVRVRRNGAEIVGSLKEIVEAHQPQDLLQALGIDEEGEAEWKRVNQVIKIKPTEPVCHLTFPGSEPVIATADHLWPVKTATGWQTKRTDELEPHDRLAKLTSGYDGTSQLNFLSPSSIRIIEGYDDYVYCFELDSPSPWFAVQDGIITHNCFGYLGFKNARWGSIESHQCVTAYSRRYLLQARQVCEEYGFRVIAGITDSLFIQPTAPDFDSADRVRDLVREISHRCSIPLDIEGRFQWVIFCNIKEFTTVAALNRYFGYFDHGEFKLRGIKHRQRRAAPAEKKFQEDILDIFREATTLEQFEALIPRANRKLIWWKEQLQAQKVPPKDLVIKLKSGRGADGYRATTTIQALTVKKYQDQGKTLMPGQNFFYLVRNDSLRTTDRLIIGPNVTADSKYDADFYCKLLEDNFHELMEVPQRQFYGDIRYTGNPQGELVKLDEFF